jgi:hypothetical protein
MKPPAWAALGKIDGRHLGALGLFLGASSLYLLTLAPTVQGFDSAELTVGAYTLSFIHAPGYPLYLSIGHLFAGIPIGDVGLRLNLMSAVLGILTLMVLYKLLLLHTGEWLISLGAAALFAATPIFWSQAIRAEVYTLHTLLIAGALLAWLDASRSGRLGSYLVCYVLLGMGMANHPTTALLWLSVLVCAIWSDPRWRKATIPATLLGLGVAAACYALFAWQSAAEPPVDYFGTYFGVDPRSLEGLWWLISGRMFRCLFSLDLSPSGLVQEMAHLGGLLWNNFLGVGLVLGVWGWSRARRLDPLWNRLLSIYFVANLALFFSYHAVDKEVMFIPIYLLGSIWVADGMLALAGWLASRLQRLDLYQASTVVSLALLAVIGCAVVLNWASVTLKDNRRAYQFAAELLEQVEPSAIIVNHWATSSVIDYLQVVEGRRPDLVNFDLSSFLLASQTRCDPADYGLDEAWLAWLSSQQGQRPLCFVEPLPTVPNNLRWVDEGACWKIAVRNGDG